jgi:hypothetical protein
MGIVSSVQNAPPINADERRLKTNELIGVHRRLSAAESAFGRLSEHLPAPGKKSSRLLAVSEDWMVVH